MEDTEIREMSNRSI